MYIHAAGITQASSARSTSASQRKRTSSNNQKQAKSGTQTRASPEPAPQTQTQTSLNSSTSAKRSALPTHGLRRASPILEDDVTSKNNVRLSSSQHPKGAKARTNIRASSPPLPASPTQTRVSSPPIPYSPAHDFTPARGPPIRPASPPLPDDTASPRLKRMRSPSTPPPPSKRAASPPLPYSPRHHDSSAHEGGPVHHISPGSVINGNRPDQVRSGSPHVVKKEEEEATVASPVAAHREIPKARERENRGGVKEQLQKLAEKRRKEADSNALSSMLGL
jgi:hypothetical protein